MKKKMTGLMLMFAAIAATLATAPSASADQLPSQGIWAKSQDYKSSYLCQSAGLTGQFFGLWKEDEWKCDGATLFVLQPAPLLPIG